MTRDVGTLARGLDGFGHPIRIRPMVLLEQERPPPGLRQQLNSNDALGVSYHVRELREATLIAETRTEPRRGTLGHFYRRTSPLHRPSIPMACGPAPQFPRPLVTIAFDADHNITGISPAGPFIDPTPEVYRAWRRTGKTLANSSLSFSEAATSFLLSAGAAPSSTVRHNDPNGCERSEAFTSRSQPVSPYSG